VRLGVDFGGSAVTLRARGITLGAAGFASTGRGRVRGGRIETCGRVSCLASAGTAFGAVAGAAFSCPASAGTGCGAVAGGSGAGATCASAGPHAENRHVATIVELSHRDRRTRSGTGLAAKLNAVRSFARREPRLLAVMMMEDTETPRVARLVARHRERSLPTESRMGFLGSATIDTPRPMCSRVTTADGRSPGSRVTTFRRLPETRESQWHDDERFAAYSCGGSRSFGQSLARTAFPINPLWGTVTLLVLCVPHRNQVVFRTARVIVDLCAVTATN
jgi:hypothetical protein